MNVNSSNTSASSAGRAIPQQRSSSFQANNLSGGSFTSSLPTVQPSQGTPFKQFDYSKYDCLNATIVHSEECQSSTRLHFSFKRSK